MKSGSLGVLSQKLSNHDQENIVQRIHDISEHFKSKHSDLKILDEESKFYLNHSSNEEDKETLLESCVNQDLIPQREEILEILKKKVENENGDSDQGKGKGKYQIKEEVKSAIPSSKGLRNCLKSVGTQYLWGKKKLIGRTLH